MIFDQRVLYSDNGLISDLSTDVADFKNESATFNYSAGEDYIYIGSYLPFNHKWIELTVANTASSSIAVEIWDGSNWNSTIDIQDMTSVGSASFGRSGIVRFVHDREEHWARETDSFDVEGLSATEIYGLYWARLSFSLDLDAGVSLKFVGQKFSGDTDLFLYYPDLNNTGLLNAFAAGKTTWDDQSFMATDRLVRDLKKNNSIVSSDQIIDYEIFNEANVHKTAEIIFYGLGASYADLRDRAETKYSEALAQGFLNLDRSANGHLSTAERRYRQGFLTR